MSRLAAWIDRHPGLSLVAAVFLGLAAQTEYISWRYDGSAVAARTRWDLRERETQANHAESIRAASAIRDTVAARCTSH